MSIVVHDPDVARRLLDQRRASGADRYDEVWEGVYMMSPMPDLEHQGIVGALTGVLWTVVMEPGLGVVLPGANLSRLAEDWKDDYRVPDILVFLDREGEEVSGSHWRGPADFLIEVVSPGDQTYEKLPFYGQIGVRELLVIDRDPWSLQIYRGSRGKMRKAARADLRGGEVRSTVLGLSFGLVRAKPRPQVRVGHARSGRNWLV